MTRYDFKLWPEALRAFVIAASAFGLSLAAGLDGTAVDSWERWAFSAAVGVAVAGAQAALAVLTRNSPTA